MTSPRAPYPSPYDGAYPRISAPGSTPLSALPVSDWVRDGAAAALLLVSLALPWSYSFSSEGILGAGSFALTSTAATRLDVLLITILSVLSLATTYLARTGALGAALTPGRTAALRAALNAPYAVLVLVYIVLDAARAGDIAGYLGTGAGLGAAVTLGLAGALMAAVPRLHETRDPQSGPRLIRAGFIGTIVVLAVVALTTVIGFILLLLLMTGGAATPGWTLASALLLLLLQDGALLLPAVLVMRRSAVAARISGAVGIATLAAVTVSALTGFALGGAVASLHGGGYLLVWFGTYAALMTAPALLASMHTPPPLTTWFVTARQALVTLVAVAGALSLFTVISLLSVPANSVGFFVGVLFAQVATIVVGLIARVRLVSAPQSSRTIVLSLTAVAAGAQIVALVLSATAPAGGGGYFLVAEPVAYLVALGLPVLIGYSLLAPAAVRDYYRAFAPVAPAPHYTPQEAPPQHYAPVPHEAAAQPQQHANPQQYASPQQHLDPQQYANPQQHLDPQLSDLARRAADPSTPGDELYRYASDPTLWAALASNPALYPDLAAWLAQTGDPNVLAALRARGAI